MSGNLIIKNASELVTVSGFEAKKGPAMAELSLIPDGSVVIEQGRITRVGPTCEVLAGLDEAAFTVVDATGKAVLPGFVDAHTHFVFGGYRAEEFSLRLRGMSYMEIMQRGGGIAATVEATRSATEEELAALGAEKARQDALLRCDHRGGEERLRPRPGNRAEAAPGDEDIKRLSSRRRGADVPRRPRGAGGLPRGPRRVHRLHRQRGAPGGRPAAPRRILRYLLRGGRFRPRPIETASGGCEVVRLTREAARRRADAARGRRACRRLGGGLGRSPAPCVGGRHQSDGRRRV